MSANPDLQLCSRTPNHSYRIATRTRRPAPTSGEYQHMHCDIRQFFKLTRAPMRATHARLARRARRRVIPPGAQGHTVLLARPAPGPPWAGPDLSICRSSFYLLHQRDTPRVTMLPAALPTKYADNFGGYQSAFVIIGGRDRLAFFTVAVGLRPSEFHVVTCSHREYAQWVKGLQF